MATKLTISDKRSLAAFIDSCPIIDHHAHPLLPLSAQTEADVIATTTEASGAAQSAASTGLPFIRALEGLFLGEESSMRDAPAKERFQQYLSKRRNFEEKSFTQQSFSGIQTILIDDGLRHPGALYPYDWHSQFLKSPAKRIVRIETLAEDILQEQRDRGGEASIRALESAIKNAIADKEVVGFKSVSCSMCCIVIAKADRNSRQSATGQVWILLQDWTTQPSMIT